MGVPQTTHTHTLLLFPLHIDPTTQSVLTGNEPTSFPPAEESWHCVCHFDLRKLRAYCERGTDARQDQLETFLQEAETHGTPTEHGYTAMTQAPRP